MHNISLALLSISVLNGTEMYCYWCYLLRLGEIRPFYVYIFFIVVLRVECDIYKISYNIS
jgi:hypothetical protein